MEQNEKYIKKVRRKQRKLWFNDELAKLDAEMEPIRAQMEELQKKRSTLHKQMWGITW
jgi:seryl-tRNA synthetase